MADPIAVSVEVGAEMIDVSSSVLRAYIDQGLVPVVKLPSTKRVGEQSRRVLIAISDLERFIEQHRTVEHQPNAQLSAASIKAWDRRRKDGAA